MQKLGLQILFWIHRFPFQNKKLGGGFKYFYFYPLLGEMIQFDEHIFQMGWFNHQLEKHRKQIPLMALDSENNASTCKME